MPENDLNVAIVGAGPAGFYAAGALLKQDEYRIDFSGQYAVISKHEIMMTPAGYERMIPVLETFLAMLPEYVIEQQKGLG